MEKIKNSLVHATTESLHVFKVICEHIYTFNTINKDKCQILNLG